MTEPVPQPLKMTTELRDADGTSVAVVGISGEIDLSNADELETVLFAEPCSRCDGLVIDLTGVPFMDSSGLRVLLIAARDANPRLAMVLQPDSPVMRLLDYAEMTELIPITSTENEAIEAVRAPG